MSDPTLFDTFGHRGIFWLPQTPERKQPGTVRFTDKNVELDILGTLADNPLPGLVQPAFQPQCVVGVTENGKPLTIHNCIQTTFTTGTGIGSSKLIAENLIIGGQYASENDLRFHSMTVNFFDLEEWIAHLPFRFNPVPTEHDNGSKSYFGEYVQPQKFTFNVPPIEAQFSIGSGWSHEGVLNFRQEVRGHLAWLELEPTPERPLLWYLDRIRQLQNLFTLLMGQATFPRLVKFQGPLIPGQNTLRQEINVFFHPTFGKVGKGTHPTRMLTLFPYLEASRFGTVLTHWFSKQELLRDVCDLYFGVIYNEFLYLRFHFLGLVQALETYCRFTQHGQYVSHADYKLIADALIAAIPATTPQDLRDSLKRGKIKYGNEYALRKRLRLLLCSLEDDTSRMVTDKPTQFCEDVVATRNYYTHYTSELESQAFSDSDLFWASMRLRVLMTIVLFKEIGLEEPLIRQMWAHPNNQSQIAAAVRSNYQTF